ncbi:hypothetical protein Hanom_Chr03g00213411 [Helianthus anomalus]
MISQPPVSHKSTKTESTKPNRALRLSPFSSRFSFCGPWVVVVVVILPLWWFDFGPA